MVVEEAIEVHQAHRGAAELALVQDRQ